MSEYYNYKITKMKLDQQGDQESISKVVLKHIHVRFFKKFFSSFF